MVDVKGRRCEFTHCNKIASYGLQGRQPSACLLHRGTAMVEMKQHRPRPASGAKKMNGVNVKLGNGGGTAAAGAAADSSRNSPLSVVSKWDKRGRAVGHTVVAADGENSSVFAIEETTASSNMGRSRLVQHGKVTTPSMQSWRSDHAPYQTNLPAQSASGQGIRSWGLSGSSHQQAGPGGGASGSERTSPRAWGQNRMSTPSSSEHDVSCGIGSNVDGSGETSPMSHYSRPGMHRTGVLPAIMSRGSSSLPALSTTSIGGGRFPGGGDGGSGGSHLGSGGDAARTSTESWRLPPVGQHSLGGGFQYQFPGMSSTGTEEHANDMIASAGGSGSHGNSTGGGGDAGNDGSLSRPEHGLSPCEMGIGDVESEDIWLRDFMQGPITTRANTPHHHGSGGTVASSMELPHPSPAAAAADITSSSGLPRLMNTQQHQYARNVGLNSTSGEHSPAAIRSVSLSGLQAEGRRPTHHPGSQQHRPPQSPLPPSHHEQQHQHHGRQGSLRGGSLSMIGGGAGDGMSMSRQLPMPQSDYSGLSSSGGNSGNDSTANLGYMKETTNIGSSRQRCMSPALNTGRRSPSAASSGASPPHDPGDSYKDALHRKQTGKYDGNGGGAIYSVGGSGGNPSFGGDGGVSRGGARGGGVLPYSQFSNLPGMAGYDAGHEGLMSDLQFVPSCRVESPAWGAGGV